MKILVVEDELVTADNVAAILSQAGHDVCGIAQDAGEAIQIFQQCVPDLVICDVRLQGDSDGITFQKEAVSLKPVPFIYLTAFTDKTTVTRAAETAPMAYLVKPFTEQQLLAAVSLAEIKITQQREQTAVLPPPSKRELEVLERIARGLSSKQIADQLFISDFTVQTHRKNLLERYGTPSSIELVMLALRQGWIRL